ncbi:MAG: cupin domain-containing protein [Oscillospiraceae bacterium]|jgi:transcriptional regulator with XRE-family HTH domain|nr:cupin domain-containing protein [Oscillospiraceae bacterium]
MTDETFLQIGRRVREMREICGFSDLDIAARLNLSPETYRGYENSGKDIPISVMYELATLFGVDLNEILTGNAPRLADYCLVKKGFGTVTERFSGYSYKSLAARFKNKIMEPLLVTVEPGNADHGLVSHKGQEFNLCLEGKLLLRFDGKDLELEPGDSIYFSASHPHGQFALDSAPAVFLTVIAE